MKTKLFIMKIIFVFLFCSVLTNMASAEKKLSIGMMHFPPFSDLTDINNPKGEFVDKMLKTLDEAGIPHTGVNGYPPKRHYTFLGNGRTDFSVASKGVPYYDKSVIYSKTIVLDVQCYVMSLPDQPLPPKNFKEWTGKVILVTGYGYGKLRKNLEEIEKEGHLKLIDAPQHKNLFLMLKAKRGKYALNYKGPTEKFLKIVNIPNIQKRTLFSVKVHFVLNKNIPNAQNLMNRIEKAYLKLDSQGVFKK